MDSMRAPGHTDNGASLGLGATALGRLQVRVREDDGFQEVRVERRWPDLASARSWCERTLARMPEGSTVLEIEVFQERWQHPRSWEAIRPRPVAEALQLGVVGSTGSVRWGEPRSIMPLVGARRLI